MVTRESSWPDCQRVVEGHRQPLEVGVEVVADLGLEAEDRARLHPPAHPDQHRLEHAEAEGEQAEREHGAAGRRR